MKLITLLVAIALPITASCYPSNKNSSNELIPGYPSDKWKIVPRVKPKDCRHDNNTFNCVEYLRNYDGDTITFNIPGVHSLIGNQISVRVAGIDTPEMRGATDCEKKLAIKAKDFVSEALTKAKKISLTSIGRDKYFRILASVEADGVSVGHQLIAAGLARPYFGGSKSDKEWCP